MPVAPLVRRRKPGYSLEAPFYLSDEVFAADLEAIWARHWIHVGVEADVPQPGDYYVVGFGRYSVVIVRGADGVARLPQCLPPSRRAHHQ